MLAALLAQLDGLAREQPVLMLFEDLHWIDPTSLEFLTAIVDRVQHLPVLLLATARPGVYVALARQFAAVYAVNRRR
jgi:predicted ATPase